jgi:DNA-binding CsgD family transcriptional regulator/tetratricopeptide (TPR) repeat protein
MDDAVPAARPLLGRESEVRLLGELLDRVTDQGGALVVSGGPGIGKSALLAEAARRGRERGMLVLKVTGVQSEAVLPFAGLHSLLRPLLGRVDALGARQRDAVLAAFGMTDAAAPDPFLTALAALDLLAEAAARAPVVVVVDDAHWLDQATRDALTFVARRLEFEPILLVAAIRDGYESPLRAAGLPALALGALPPPTAAALLDSRSPGLPAGVRERFLREAAGNPLALVELPIARGQVGGEDAGDAGWLPLTTRLEQAFTARALDLPAITQTALLVAALDDGPLLGEVLAAAALPADPDAGPGAAPAPALALTVGVLVPAVSAQLVEIDGTRLRFRHPLIRTAIRQHASVSQRQVAHAALARALAREPERAVWHRAAAIIGPDEAVADELEATALRVQRRGASVVAVSALRRAAALGDSGRRAGRLLRAAELGFELGRQDLVQDLLAEAGPDDLTPREQARVAWIRDSFADGIPGETSKARSLAVSAERAGADGDTDLALKLLYGAALRCWWADPGEATRDDVAATAEGLKVSDDDPRLLVVLALATPTGRGASVVERLYKLGPDIESDAGTTRLAGNTAMAVGAFDLAARFLALSAASLRTQGRLGLLARALALQAWSSAQLADLGTAIPAAAEARRLAQETRQPLIIATADAVQALLAALRGDEQSAGTLAAQAEEICVPIGASAVLAATQFARGLAALGAGRPADALEHLRRIQDPADPCYHYAVRYYTVGDLAEAAQRSGEVASIGGFMRELEAVGQQTASPSVQAGLRHARALLADDAAAPGQFDAALRSGSWPFQRARVQLAHGEWLHQHRQNAASRAPLRAARETFDALGLVPWSERARQRLRATGETSRPRTPQARDQLTPQELQIVQLAAAGMSNREIGQRLYLSHRTVSSHLYRVFPKLGITSRAELPAALGR